MLGCKLVTPELWSRTISSLIALKLGQSPAQSWEMLMQGQGVLKLFSHLYVKQLLMILFFSSAS